MKKKAVERSFFGELLTGIKIYRGDLEDIIGILKTSFEEVSIEDSTSVFDSIDDVIEHRGYKPKELAIKGCNDPLSDCIEVRFQGSRARVLDDTRTGQDSSYFHLNELLKSKIKWHYKVIDPVWLGPAFFIIFIIGAIVAIEVVESRSAIDIWRYSAPTLFAIWLLVIVFRRFYYGISLRRIHESTFIKRNQDQIILLVVGSILGVIGTLLIQSFFK